MHRLATLPIVLLALAVALAGCDTGRSSASPSASLPPPQWPVAGHDPQRTSTGPARGPIDPASVQGFPRRGKGSGAGAPVVGVDGTLYTAIGEGVYAILPDGSERGRGWPVAMAPGDAPRLGIAPNGSVFVGRASFLTLLDPNTGTAREGWPVTRPKKIVSVFVVTSDTAYIGWVDDQSTTVEAYTMGGKLRAGWPVELPKEALSSIAVAPDGTVYLAGRKLIYGLAPDGKPRSGWPAAIAANDSGPASTLTIGPDGTVYAIVLAGERASSLYALAPDGTMRPGWPYRADGSMTNLLLAIGPDGTVYEGVGDSLHALSVGSGPVLRWKTDAGVRTVDALAIGADGTLYLAETDPGGTPRLSARGTDGKELPGWPLGFTLQGARLIGMAEGRNGVLYVTSSDGNVLAYIDRSAGSSPSASVGASAAAGSSPSAGTPSGASPSGASPSAGASAPVSPAGPSSSAP